MKNESNTNPTPGFWHVTQSVNVASDKGKIIAFTSDRIVNSKGGISAFNHEERKANAQLIARAPELLKENQELKRALEDEKALFIETATQGGNLRALNAELLEALKETSRYFVKRSGKGKMAKRVEALVNSAIAKAEGKTLGVS